MKKLTLLTLFSFLVMATNGFCCSDFLLNNSGESVISARTMDFLMPLKAKVVVVPRGRKCASHTLPTDTYMQWTSRYGFVGTNLLDKMAFTDGLNEKGLSVATLWLIGSSYQKAADLPRDKVIIVTDLTEWILGNFATIEEVKEGLTSVFVGEMPVKLGGSFLELHFAIHDRNNKSLVIEFVDGKMAVYDNPYNVLTNEPSFPEQIKNLEKKSEPIDTFAELKTPENSTTSRSRFALLHALNKAVDKAKSLRQAVTNAHHILNRVTLVNNETPANGSTQYQVIRDHQNLIYYVTDNENMNLRALDMKKIDFSPSTPVRSFPIANDKWYLTANNELKPFKEKPLDPNKLDVR